MLAALMLAASGWAGSFDPPVLREASPDDCTQSTAIRAGDGLAITIAGPDGTAACNAVAIPPVQLAYLLQLEEYHHARERLHALDVELLQTERNWYRDQLATQSAPVAWYETKAAARWGGRLEVLAVVAVLSAGIGYHVSR
tara:strand:+ start:457 stop:879 length:423 start_codon:yes stop_codon:yes gene_type:complete